MKRTPVVAVLVPSTIRGTPPLFQLVHVALSEQSGRPMITVTECVRGYGMALDSVAGQIVFFCEEIKKRLPRYADVAGCIITSNNWDTAMRVQQGLINDGIERARDFMCCPRTIEDAPFDHDLTAGMVLRLLLNGAFGVAPPATNECGE
jgi:hypothetical protein